MTSYTVLMPVFNASAVVSRTLSYLHFTGIEPDRIVVADDASTDAGLESLREWASQLGMRWDRLETNVGYTRNINRCLQAVETEFVLILNSDCFITRHSVEALVKVLQDFDVLACTGPLSTNAGHQTVLLKRDIRWNALDNEEIVLFSRRIETSLAEEFGLRPWVMPSINGFCCLWRTSILRALNFFDGIEFPRGYGEEDDACIRLTETGRFPAIAPFVFAPHLKTQSFSTKERDSLKAHAINKLRLKFSSACIDRLVNHFTRSPQISELKRLPVGGQDV